ncbi:hypothetical protein GCK32_007163, partial [Trichostrongylus colubriformis]
TTAHNVYAIGDVVSTPLPLWEIESINIQHFQTAQEHGHRLGFSILNRPFPHEMTPFFWTLFFFEFGIRFAGCDQGTNETIVHGDLDRFDFAKYYLRNGVVVAVANSGPTPTAIQFLELFERNVQVTREDVEKNTTRDWMAWLNQ